MSEFNLKKYLAEGKLLKENQLFSKYINTPLPDGSEMVISFSFPDAEELGLDYDTLEEVLEIKEIKGVKVCFVHMPK
tara:strand:- start:157 stop:387 length:231 start_codon:yes stop_codon:yes gene_type:complete